MAAGILGVVHVPTIMSLENKMFSSAEELQNSCILLGESTSQSSDALPAAEVSEFQWWGKLKVCIQEYGKTRKTLKFPKLGFPKNSWFKTIGNWDMPACGTPFSENSDFLGTMKRLFWSVLARNMIISLKSSFPLFFPVPFCHRLMLNGQTPNVWSQIISL